MSCHPGCSSCSKALGLAAGSGVHRCQDTTSIIDSIIELRRRLSPRAASSDVVNKLFDLRRKRGRNQSTSRARTLTVDHCKMGRKTTMDQRRKMKDFGSFGRSMKRFLVLFQGNAVSLCFSLRVVADVRHEDTYPRTLAHCLVQKVFSSGCMHVQDVSVLV